MTRNLLGSDLNAIRISCGRLLTGTGGRVNDTRRNMTGLTRNVLPTRCRGGVRTDVTDNIGGAVNGALGSLNTHNVLNDDIASATLGSVSGGTTSAVTRRCRGGVNVLGNLCNRRTSLTNGRVSADTKTRRTTRRPTLGL